MLEIVEVLDYGGLEFLESIKKCMPDESWIPEIPH
jgi:hypothetical protein